MRCLNCGTELLPGDHYCKNCGMSTERGLKRPRSASDRGSRCLKRTIIAVAVFGAVMFAWMYLLILMGGLYDVLEKL